MFTGIVQGVSKVLSVANKNGLTSFSIDIKDELLNNIKIGASIAIDGVCLTVVNVDRNIIFFDAIQETLDKTTIGTIQENNFVNVERSLKQGDEIGGHIVSGHIDFKAKITNISKSENNYCIYFSCLDNIKWMKYIFSKGFIAINGASLTIVDSYKYGEFTVHLIPETLRATTFILKKIGDFVNIEIDRNIQAIVDTVDTYLSNNKFN